MIIKIAPDKEKAKSLLKMAESRKQFITEVEKIKAQTTIIAENYYEVIKKLLTAIALIEGYKTIGENAHKELIDSMEKYGRFNEYEIQTIQDLRIRRNKSSYEGKPIEGIYLENKKEILVQIIKKAKMIVEEKLK